MTYNAKAEFALKMSLSKEAIDSAVSCSEEGNFTSAYEFADAAVSYAKEARDIAQSKTFAD